MDLQLLLDKISPVKNTINFPENIQGFSFGRVEKGKINVLPLDQYSTEARGITYFLMTDQEDYLNDRHNNIILAKEDTYFYLLDQMQEELEANRSFYTGILKRVAEKGNFSQVMEDIKAYFQTNVAILAANQKLVYNIFDFKTMNKTYALEIKENRMTRRYGYLGFENLQEKYQREAAACAQALGPVIYHEILEVINFGDGFYETLKGLILGQYSRQSERSLATIGWALTDPYSLMVAEISGGRYKYQELFVHGSRFKLDHPMALYSAVSEDRLVLLINEKHEELRYLKGQARQLLEEQDMPFLSLSLKNNLLNFEKSYRFLDELLDRGLRPAEPLEDHLREIAFDLLGQERDYSLFIPAELQRLLEEDEKENSELVKTLYYYLLEERSLLKAAELLQVHRNSVVYRTKKIEEMTGISYDDYLYRNNLLVCLELLKREKPDLF